MKIRIRNVPLLAAGLKRLAAIREKKIAARASRKRAAIGAVHIGVTGSSAKSTTTALLAHILAAAGKVRAQSGPNTLGPMVRTLSRMSWRTRFVVVECGVGRLGQMSPMATALRPDMAIVTLVALEHKSAFRTIEAVAAEKSELVAGMAPGGIAILNAEDPLVLGMSARTTGRVVTFGRSEGAAFRAANVRAAFPDRLSLTAVWPGGTLTLRTNFVGEHFWLPTMAAFAAAIELGVPVETVAARIATFQPLPAAGGVIAVPGGPQFVLDTTKAPWHSIPLAFDIVAQSTARRRRIVLGHMSDFAGSNEKYRDAYRLARAVADEVVFVGNHAHRSRASQQDQDDGRFSAFTTPREAAEYLRATAVPGEVILIKGSVDLHLERIALSFGEDVRCWIPACGKRQGCVGCRRYGEPYEWHKGRKKRGRLMRPLRRFSRFLKMASSRRADGVTTPERRA